jgi:hypothetical protein
MRFFTSFRMTIFHFKVIATQPLDRGIQRKKLDLEPAPFSIRGVKPALDLIGGRKMTTIGTEFAMNKQG